MSSNGKRATAMVAVMVVNIYISGQLKWLISVLNVFGLNSFAIRNVVGQWVTKSAKLQLLFFCEMQIFYRDVFLNHTLIPHCRCAKNLNVVGFFSLSLSISSSVEFNASVHGTRNRMKSVVGNSTTTANSKQQQQQ